jgi:hypothetical protein
MSRKSDSTPSNITIRSIGVPQGRPASFTLSIPIIRFTPSSRASRPATHVERAASRRSLRRRPPQRSMAFAPSIPSGSPCAADRCSPSTPVEIESRPRTRMVSACGILVISPFHHSVWAQFCLGTPDTTLFVDFTGDLEARERACPTGGFLDMVGFHKIDPRRSSIGLNVDHRENPRRGALPR